MTDEDLIKELRRDAKYALTIGGHLTELNLRTAADRLESLTALLAAKESENARLRAALEWIAADAAPGFNMLSDVARNALDLKEPPPCPTAKESNP